LIVKAIQAVMKGRTYICPKMRESLSIKNKGEGFSDMEFSITEQRLVKMLSEGFSSSEIAIELGLSIRSTETYRHRLIKRLKVANSVELIDYFYKNGLMKD